MMLNKILDEHIKCPSCDALSNPIDWQLDLDSNWVEGFAVCPNKCGPLLTFDFSIRCDILAIIVTCGPHFNEYQIVKSLKNKENKMQKVSIIRHKNAKNLIAGVFTTQDAAMKEFGSFDHLEIKEFECPHEGISFPVWIVTVGKGKAYRVIGVFSNEKKASKIASSIGGRIVNNEAIPNRRMRQRIVVYKSYVSLESSDRDRCYAVDEITISRRMFENEERDIFPVATFRRPYDRSLPHRIEILAPNQADSMNAAKELAKLSNEEIVNLLEYNVEYKMIKENGIWKIDSSLLNQPVEES